MSNTIKVIAFSFTLFAISGCFTQKSVARYLKKHPELLTSDTITKTVTKVKTLEVFVPKDSIEVGIDLTGKLDSILIAETDKMRAEIAFSFDTLRQLIPGTEMQYKTVIVPKYIEVKAEVKPDTVLISYRDTIKVEKIVNSIEVKDVHRVPFWLYFVIAVILILLIKAYLDAKNN